MALITAFDSAVAPVLIRFRAAYPAVEIEVEGRLVDVVEQGFDAGLRYGDVLACDVVAVKLAPGSEALLASAPGYLRHRPAPEHRACPALGHAAQRGCGPGLPAYAHGRRRPGVAA